MSILIGFITAYFVWSLIASLLVWAACYVGAES
jgi:hypothetical protein